MALKGFPDTIYSYILSLKVYTFEGFSNQDKLMEW